MYNYLDLKDYIRGVNVTLMSLLIADLFQNNTESLKFATDSEAIQPILVTVLASVGIPVIVYLLAVNLSRPNVPSMILIYNLCFADLALLTTCIVFSLSNFLAGGWGTGKMGCILSSSLLAPMALYTILSIMLIALERYLSVCRALRLSSANIILLLSVAFLISLFPVLLSFVIDNYETIIGLESGKGNCLIAWYSPAARPIVIFTVIVGAISMSILTFSYYAVYIKFQQVFENISRRTKNYTKEISILKSCIGLTAVFLICWSPMLFLVVMQAITGHPDSSLLNNVSNLLAILNSVLDPFLLLYFDNRVRGVKKNYTQSESEVSKATEMPEPINAPTRIAHNSFVE